jgi:hypothetical protein
MLKLWLMPQPSILLAVRLAASDEQLFQAIIAKLQDTSRKTVTKSEATRLAIRALAVHVGLLEEPEAQSAEGAP